MKFPSFIVNGAVATSIFFNGGVPPEQPPVLDSNSNIIQPSQELPPGVNCYIPPGVNPEEFSEHPIGVPMTRANLENYRMLLELWKDILGYDPTSTNWAMPAVVPFPNDETPPPEDCTFEDPNHLSMLWGVPPEHFSPPVDYVKMRTETTKSLGIVRIYYDDATDPNHYHPIVEQVEDPQEHLIDIYVADLEEKLGKGFDPKGITGLVTAFNEPGPQQMILHADEHARLSITAGLVFENANVAAPVFSLYLRDNFRQWLEAYRDFSQAPTVYTYLANANATHADLTLSVDPDQINVAEIRNPYYQPDFEFPTTFAFHAYKNYMYEDLRASIEEMRETYREVTGKELETIIIHEGGALKDEYTLEEYYEIYREQIETVFRLNAEGVKVLYIPFGPSAFTFKLDENNKPVLDENGDPIYIVSDPHIADPNNGLIINQLVEPFYNEETDDYGYRLTDMGQVYMQALNDTAKKFAAERCYPIETYNDLVEYMEQTGVDFADIPSHCYFLPIAENN